MYSVLCFKRRGLRIAAFFLAVILLCAFFIRGPSAAPASAQTQEGAKVPIIMYHGILKDTKRQGEYVISPDTFENDLKFLKEQGYTTIVMQDLIDYVHGADLPEKPIMLTFDDGYYNNYLYAYPLLQQYESKIVLSPIGYWADHYTQSNETNANYTHCTWPMLKEMSDSGLVELQNHSYNMHTNQGGRNGTKKNKGESEEAYRAVLTEDAKKAQEGFAANIGKGPSTFVYPFGAISYASVDILKELGFQATLTCESKMNYIPRDPEALYGLRRFLRPSGESSNQYFERILNS